MMNQKNVQDIFTQYMTSLGQDVSAIDDYARAGASGPPSAAHLIARVTGPESTALFVLGLRRAL